jgi:hypothetical protein
LLNSFGVLPPLPGFAWRNESKIYALFCNLIFYKKKIAC